MHEATTALLSEHRAQSKCLSSRRRQALTPRTSPQTASIGAKREMRAALQQTTPILLEPDCGFSNPHFTPNYRRVPRWRVITGLIVTSNPAPLPVRGASRFAFEPAGKIPKSSEGPQLSEGARVEGSVLGALPRLMQPSFVKGHGFSRAVQGPKCVAFRP